MSDRKKKTKTINKKRKVRKKRGSHRKKLTSRKKKLIVLASLLIIIFVTGFVGVKVTQFVRGTLPNISLIKSTIFGEGIDKEDVDSKEQYDIDDEKKDVVKSKHNVFIDAGFGGYEKGYTNDKNTVEKDINLEISKKVAQELSKEEDINVIMSRQEDLYMSIEERKKLAESQNAKVFVSIHMSSEPTGTAKGVETIYSEEATDGSADLATIVQNSMAAYVKTENRGTSAHNMSILKSNSMPSIYIQCGFLSNKDDEKNLTDDKYQSDLAQGIAQGILTYIDADK